MQPSYCAEASNCQEIIIFRLTGACTEDNILEPSGQATLAPLGKTRESCRPSSWTLSADYALGWVVKDISFLTRNGLTSFATQIQNLKPPITDPQTLTGNLFQQS